MGDKDLRSTLLQRERSALSIESRPSTTHATARVNIHSLLFYFLHSWRQKYLCFKQTSQDNYSLWKILPPLNLCNKHSLTKLFIIQKKKNKPNTVQPFHLKSNCTCAFVKPFTNRVLTASCPSDFVIFSHFLYCD